MPFFNDTFTEASDTTLASHTPDTGDSWTLLWRTGTEAMQVTGGTDTCEATANSADAGIIYTADATYPSADYDATFTLVALGTSVRPLYVFVRLADQENMYAVRLVTGTTLCQLYKKVSGTWTALGDLFEDPALGSVCKLEIIGSTLKFYDDAVEVASATDSDLTAAGKAGIGLGGGAELVTSTDDVNVTAEIDNFSLNDLAVAGGGTIIVGLEAMSIMR